MSQSPLKKMLLFLTAAVVFWLTARQLLPIAMPFLLAALLALAAEPLVSVFQKRMKLPRAAATGIGVCITLVLLVLVVMVLGALALRQLKSLAGVVPDLEDTAMQGLSSMQSWLLGLVANAPEAVQPIVTRSVENLFSSGTNFLDQLSAKLLSLASGVVSRLPDSALGVGTWLLASFMISAKLPDIRRWITSHLPDSWRDKHLPTLQRLKKSVLGWLLAQCKLMGITFLILGVGFFILQIRHALLWAAVVSLVDALPVLGTGMVLIPWSLVCLLQGETVRAVGLLGVYIASALTRSIMEPKLIGKQLGLDSLVTLIAMYAGYCLWGIAGMILAPLLAVTATQLLTARET